MHVPECACVVLFTKGNVPFGSAKKFKRSMEVNCVLLVEGTRVRLSCMERISRSASVCVCAVPLVRQGAAWRHLNCYYGNCRYTEMHVPVCLWPSLSPPLFPVTLLLLLCGSMILITSLFPGYHGFFFLI